MSYTKGKSKLTHSRRIKQIKKKIEQFYFNFYSFIHLKKKIKQLPVPGSSEDH